MQTYSLAPLLTQKDDAESAEGGLDPLGTESLADTLASNLVPGVRERMSRPRFLTAIAASLEVCRDFADDTIAKDGISEPWQVFEWYLVEGMVRTADADQRKGLPGSLKAAQAIDDGVPISAKRYLKTPTVFGLHGVYRNLARNLGIDESGRLGETGFQLLTIWAKEQGLEGFCGTGGGPGRDVREQLVGAVREGLNQGATTRSSGWAGWEFFSKHLAPYPPGRDEARFLLSALLADPKGYRKHVIDFLVSPAGRRAWEANSSERQFHKELRRNSSNGLAPLLDAIDSYESLSRLCEDAFRDCLYELTGQGGRKTPPTLLATLPSVKQASERVPAMFGDVLTRLEPLGLASRLANTLSLLAEKGTPPEWTARLIKHHQQTQRNKPPNGKNPWFEQFDDGSVIIRPEYRTDDTGAHDGSYVHLYRTRPLWNFAADLRVIKA
jgi:hypothetical protein